MEGAFETNVGDIDGDGHLDILPNAGHEVLFGDGAGNFEESPGPDPALADGALGDLDGDGRADIIGFMSSLRNHRAGVNPQHSVSGGASSGHSKPLHQLVADSWRSQRNTLYRTSTPTAAAANTIRVGSR